ncbi:VOC family protein [Staphylococcus ureilyticus]|uniref:VOC family protein n=1 Tax=Staphylococcus ureilyticus TaxID=94138 RepID=UPI0030C0273C
MKLNNTRLLVLNFDDCLNFYQEVLGLKLLWGGLGGNYASLDAGDGKELGLFKKEIMADAIGTTDIPKKSSPQDSVALVFEVDDLERIVREIKQRGETIIAAIQDRPLWGIRTAHLRDPDGNLIELFTELKS